MARKAGLGRGLSSLISETAIEAKAESNEPMELELSKVHPNADQPRKAFEEEELQELADSIQQVGVLQPILVKQQGDEYVIIAGERRYQAAKLAGLSTIPACLREADETETLRLALIENIQRSDLNSVEEARAFRALIDKTGMTQESLAKTLSKSRTSITNSLRLLDLSQEILDMVVNGSITAGHARALLSLADEDQRLLLAQQIVKNHLSVRQTESLAAGKIGEKSETSERQQIPDSFKRVARAMKESLAAPVSIKTAKKGFKIEISFKDEQELQSIIDRLSL